MTGKSDELQPLDADMKAEFLKQVAELETKIVERALVIKLGPLTDEELTAAIFSTKWKINKDGKKVSTIVSHKENVLIVFDKEWTGVYMHLDMHSPLCEILKDPEVREMLHKKGLVPHSLH